MSVCARTRHLEIGGNWGKLGEIGCGNPRQQQQQYLLCLRCCPGLVETDLWAGKCSRRARANSDGTSGARHTEWEHRGDAYRGTRAPLRLYLATVAIEAWYRAAAGLASTARSSRRGTLSTAGSLETGFRGSAGCLDS
jgi:hypothetical protein